MGVLAAPHRLRVGDRAGDRRAARHRRIAAFAAVTGREIDAARAAGNAVSTCMPATRSWRDPCSRAPVPPQPADTPVFDALAQSLIPYDVHVFGNHEFDYGPDFLERFVRTFASPDGVADQPFLSATLDFTDEPGWADLLEPSGGIDGAPVEGRVVAPPRSPRPGHGRRVRRRGATTWALPTISSPRRCGQRGPNHHAAVQAEVDALLAQGIDRIIRPAISRTWTTTRHSWRACAAGGHRGGRWRRRAAHRDGVDPTSSSCPGRPRIPRTIPPSSRTWTAERSPSSPPAATTSTGPPRRDFGADGEVVAVDPGLSYPRRVIPDIQPRACSPSWTSRRGHPDPDRWPRWWARGRLPRHLRGDPVAHPSRAQRGARQQRPVRAGCPVRRDQRRNLVADSYPTPTTRTRPRRA